MEALGLYLLKSVIWITGFTVIYVLFLRNERYFFLNRIYLLSGIIVSLGFPFVTLRYTVALTAEQASQSGITVAAGEAVTGSAVLGTGSIIFIVVYAIGALFVVVRYLVQATSVMRVVRQSEREPGYPVTLVQSPQNVTPFSFFSCVVVNPSVSETEKREIVNHEAVHIRQKHWFDLVLTGLLSVVQWFNPVSRIYSGFVRQNHEYLADEGALRVTSDPVVYRATLLNQIAGSPVVDLCNSFNYSLNAKRFKMMKNTATSPFRKLRLLMVVPVIALVLYAFAEPEYVVRAGEPSAAPGSAITAVPTGEVIGVVVSDAGEPLPGAAVTIKGTNVGTVTDSHGKFKLINVPDDGLLIISFVGFESKVMKPAFGSAMTIKMMKKTITVDPDQVVPPPPPPPPPATGKEGEKHVIIEELPQYPGGEAEMMKWIASNVKYPAEAARAGISGMVLVGFTVSETGKVKDVNVERPVNPLLDAEAVRVISAMPAWKPGMQDGKPVAVGFKVPVAFRLDDKVTK